MAAVMRRSVTSLGRTWLSTMFLRCKAVSDIAWSPQSMPRSAQLPADRAISPDASYTRAAREARSRRTGLPSHTVTACKRLPPYVRRPVLGRKRSPFSTSAGFGPTGTKALRPRGGVVTQRTANPRTPVQFRAWPPNPTKKTNEISIGARARRSMRAVGGHKSGHTIFG